MRAFERDVPFTITFGDGPDDALEDDLGARRYLQRAAKALHHLGARAAQQARKLVFAERIRHRRDRAEHGRGIGAQRDRDRKRLARVRNRVIAEVERAAAVGEPAHDDAVGRNHLLAINAEVLPRLRRSARHGEAPRDQRPGILGPAGLHRQAREVDVGAFPDDLLAWGRRALLRRHVEDLHE